MRMASVGAGIGRKQILVVLDITMVNAALPRQ
jgi:hypothetical protein